MATKVYKLNNVLILDDGVKKQRINGNLSSYDIDNATLIVWENGNKERTFSTAIADVQDQSGTPVGNEAAVDTYMSGITNFKSASGGNGANVGSGTGEIFGGIDSTTGDLKFKTLIAGTNVTITNNADDITLDASGGGGGNIATSDLTISAAGTRKLQMFGSAVTDVFALRNSADTDDLFFFTGDGRFAIGEGATVGVSGVAVGVGSGTSSWTGCVAVGLNANNYGHYSTTIGMQSSVSTHGVVVGNNASTSASGGVAIGRTAQAALNSTAIGLSANANVGQYNIAIGELSSCTAFFGIAIGRNAIAGDKATAINGGATLAQGTAMGYSSSAGGYALSLGAYASTGNHGTAVGYDTSANGLNTAVGRGMETSGNYSVSIGACPYGQVRTNSVASTFNWFTDATDPIVRFGETADQWNMGTGSFGFGTMTPDASAVIDLTSTTKGFLPPRMTTTERDAISTPAEGLVVYNTTTQVLNFYNGTTWGAV